MKVAATILALAFSSASGAALAVDAFTVSVPVDFKSLNGAVETVRIRCALTARSAVSMATSDFGHAKYVELPITGGNYAGPSPIAVVWRMDEFTPPEQPALPYVNGGSCQFNLVTATGSFIPYGGETAPVLAQRPGTPFRSTVRFTFLVP